MHISHRGLQPQGPRAVLEKWYAPPWEGIAYFDRRSDIAADSIVMDFGAL